MSRIKGTKGVNFTIIISVFVGCNYNIKENQGFWYKRGLFYERKNEFMFVLEVICDEWIQQWKFTYDHGMRITERLLETKKFNTKSQRQFDWIVTVLKYLRLKIKLK